MSFSAEKLDLTKLTVTELQKKNLKADLILANILFPVLEALSENISHLLEKGGLVILAGLLSEQKKERLENGTCSCLLRSRSLWILQRHDPSHP